MESGNIHVGWVQSTPEFDSYDDVPKMADYIMESKIGMQNKVFHQVIHQELGRDYDEFDVAKFHMEYIPGGSGFKVIYFDKCIGIISSCMTDDYKYVVEFTPTTAL